MLVEPRPPGGADTIARLQHRAEARARPSPHQAEMTAVPARHQLEDGVRLPMPPRAEHDAVVDPFHCKSLAATTSVVLSHDHVRRRPRRQYTARSSQLSSPRRPARDEPDMNLFLIQPIGCGA